jgi:hypothetical protein
MFSRGSHSGIWGITVNNNPTVSDVFNTTPAWMYPYLSADLAPGAPAQPMLFGGLGGQVIGASAYAQLDGAWYLEAGGYRSLSPAFLRHVNAGYDGRLSGIAPYARVTYTWRLPRGDFTIGGFLLSMRRGLAGTNDAGDAVAAAGPTDRFRDVGLDSNVSVRPSHLPLVPSDCCDASRLSRERSDEQARQGRRFRAGGVGVVAGQRPGGFSLWCGSVAGARARSVGPRAAGGFGVRVPQSSRHAPEGAGGGCPGCVAGDAPTASRALCFALDPRVAVLAQPDAVRVAVRRGGLATLVM